MDQVVNDDACRLKLDDHADDAEYNGSSSFGSLASGSRDGNLFDGLRGQHGGWLRFLGLAGESIYFGAGARFGGGSDFHDFFGCVAVSDRQLTGQ